MRSRPPPSPAVLASFTADGEVSGVWPIDAAPREIVLRDGRLLPRTPSEVLPKDARIAAVGWRSDESGRPTLILEGANLVLGPSRVAPGRPERLADGDVLVVDHRDIGERPGGVVGALLVTRDDPHPRPLRCLRERDDGAVEVTRPGAGRAWLQAGLAAIVLGALPCAAVALGQPPGLPARSSLLLAATGFLFVAAVAFALSRLLARSGPVLAWGREGLRLSRGGALAAPEALPLDDLDGFALRLGRAPTGRWTLEATLRTRRGEIRLDAGPHLSLHRDPPLLAVAALEARRQDWIEVFRRAAQALRRSPDAFVSVHTDRDWPPEKARAAVAAARFAAAET
ncbi:MAG: hypothetical protein HY907_08435 [Deltaproteobacteria bacterium]|nr:hypothetical protein [Deltaproteobacteria bacterium]